MTDTANQPIIPNVTPVITPVTTSTTVLGIRSIQLVNLLMELRGSTIITFIAKTEPDMKVTGNPYVTGKGKAAVINCRKIAKVNGQVNFWYDKAVLTRLEKEGKRPEDFKQGESWHQPVLRPDGTLTPFCQHKKTGKMYLRFRLLNLIGESTFETLDGQAIDVEKLKPFLRPASAYENQGLENPVKILVYALESIAQITMDGLTYQIMP